MQIQEISDRQRVRIEAPPPAPVPPPIQPFSFASILGSIVMGTAVIYAVSGGQTVYFMLYVPAAFLYFGIYLVNYILQRRKFNVALAQRASSYQIYLRREEECLIALQNAQRNIALRNHPPITECLSIAEHRNARLWERLPNEPDFLRLRMGVGNLPAKYEISLPTFTTLYQDPLSIQALHLLEKYAVVPHLPIALDLRRATSVGIVGTFQQLQSYLGVLLVQLATHHAPNEVNLAFLSSEHEFSELSWLAKLPHTTVFSTDSETTKRLVLEIAEEIERRKQKIRTGKDILTPIMPAIVVVIAEPMSEESEISSFAESLMRQGRTTGIYPLFASKDSGDIPKSCNTLIDLSQAPKGVIVYPDEQIAFVPDALDIPTAMKLATLLSGISGSFILDEELRQLPSLSRLTTKQLAEDINPYLDAVADIQHIIDEIQGRDYREVIVRAITQNSPVSISLDGASEAVNVLKETLSSWRRRHARTMATLDEQSRLMEIETKKAEILEKRARATRDRAEADKITAEAANHREEAERKKLENEKLRFELSRAKIDLAMSVLSQISTNLPETERTAYIVRMLPSLDSLIFSELTIASIRVMNFPPQT